MSARFLVDVGGVASSFGDCVMELLSRCGRGDRRAEHDGSGDLELRAHAPEACEKPALLGRRQLGGHRERGEIDERVADLLEAVLQVHGPRRHGRRRRRPGPQEVEWPRQERSSVHLVRGAVRRDEGERITSLEGVALQRCEDDILVLRRKRAESVGQRRSDSALRHMGLGLLR